MEQLNACKGKVRFKSSALAKQRLQEIKERGDQRVRKPSRDYYCPICGGYHLTSAPMSQKKKQLLAIRKKNKAERLAEQWISKNKNKWQS